MIRRIKMKKITALLLMAIAWLGLLAIVGGNLSAQESFPTKPISIVTGFSPGGIDDIAARAYSQAASKTFGQPVVVLYKPGAVGTIAADFVINSKPDGYTLIEYQGSSVAFRKFTHGVSWGPKDFTIILGHSVFNYSLSVRADAPWKNFNEWVQYAKQNPGFKYATPGALSTLHIMMEWIGKRLDLKIIPVHMKGDAEAIPALLGGHVQAYLSAGSQAAQIKAGKLKTLLQMTEEPVDPDPKSITRLKDVLPDAPLEIMRLPKGIFGPKGIPEPLRARLNEVFRKASVENPEFVQSQQLMNVPVRYYDPKELEEHLIKAQEQFEKVLKSLGLERK
jgi:tripartite-type tricarboxylate transporter receptor subunit TctC